MKHTKLIHDYLDGQLPQAEQGELFSELARDTALRQEFNQQVSIHSLARSDMNSITPPAGSTNAIFSTLGFKIPSSGYVSTAGSAASTFSSFGRRFSEGFGRYFPNILTASLAAVGTALLFLLLFDGFGPRQSSDYSDYAVVSSSEASKTDIYYGKGLMANAASATPYNDDMNYTLSEESVNAKEKDFWKQQYFALVNSIKDDFSRMFASRDQNTQPTDENIFSDRSLSKSSIINPPYIDFSYNNDYIKPYQKDIYAPSVYQNAMQIDGAIEKSDLSVEFRNLQGYSLVNIDEVKSSDDIWITNMALAISYNIGDNYAIGIEIGNERFAQEFKEITPNQTYNHIQNPTLTWYGGFLRKEFSDWGFSDMLYPYAQAFVGGAIANGSSEFYEHLGPLGKATLGVHWQASPNVTFNLGAEASWLLYQFQNNIYNTGKVGVTYGVNIGF